MPENRQQKVRSANPHKHLCQSCDKTYFCEKKYVDCASKLHPRKLILCPVCEQELE